MVPTLLRMYGITNNYIFQEMEIIELYFSGCAWPMPAGSPARPAGPVRVSTDEDQPGGGGGPSHAAGGRRGPVRRQRTLHTVHQGHASAGTTGHCRENQKGTNTYYTFNDQIDTEIYD